MALGLAGLNSTSQQWPALADRLLDWYHTNRRDLPWRRMQEDPYAIWVSEIMLQQTQVATVIPYFDRWMARFPTLQLLANATLDDVLVAWSGLGYYARARNLHRAARIIVEEYAGQIPRDESGITSLPGVGRYTAGAIRSIAFNEPAAIVDANVARVLSRVFEIGGDPKSSANQHRLYALAEGLIPSGQARDFNQALMELGALVCSPTDPACEHCPLLPGCFAGNSSNPTALPELPPGKRTVRATHACAIVRQNGSVLLVQRQPHGLWGGLWELPRRACIEGERPDECAVRAAQEVAGIFVEITMPASTVNHTVMHYAIKLCGFEAAITIGTPVAKDCAEVRWVEHSMIEGLALSAPQRQMLEAVRNRGKV